MPKRAKEIYETLKDNGFLRNDLTYGDGLLDAINKVKCLEGERIRWKWPSSIHNQIFNSEEWNNDCNQMMKALGCYERGLKNIDLLGDRWEEAIHNAFSNWTLENLRELVDGTGAQGALVVSETNHPSAADSLAAMILAPEEMHNGDQEASSPSFRRGVSRLCYAFQVPFDGWLTLLLRTPPAGGGGTMQGYCVNALLGANANADRPYFFKGRASFEVERTLPEGTPPGPRELYAVWSVERLEALDRLDDLTRPRYINTEAQADIVREIRDRRDQGKGHAQVFGASFTVLE